MSRLQPCRYRLFDQAWESAQSWKDKLAASCWPIATNQSHHRKRLIVSMPCSPQTESLRFMKRQKMRLVVFIKHRGCGMFPVCPHKAQLDIMYLQMVWMNTKRHRCSRANIIYCNYDNTRLIQDVGIGVGWDAFQQYSNKHCNKKKIEGWCQIFSPLWADDEYISSFLSNQLVV